MAKTEATPVTELFIADLGQIAGGVYPSDGGGSGPTRPTAPDKRITTLALGEEGGGPPTITTLALGEEGGGPPRIVPV